MAQEKAALVQGDERQSRREAIGIMVLPKLMFFLTTAAIASSGPYVPAFFDERGYNPTAIGLMMTIEPVVMILLGGPWGAFADKTQCHTLILVLSIIGCAVASATAYWTSTNVYFLQISLVFSAAFKCALWPLVNMHAIVLCKNFGRERLFGSLGWGVTSISMGFASRKWGTTVMFFVFPVLYGALAITVSVLLCTVSVKKKLLKGSRKRAPFFKSLGSVLSRWSIVSFLICSLANGYAQGHAGFYYLLLKDKFPTIDSQGSSITGDTFIIFGFGMLAAVISEVPVFFFATPLMKKITEEGLVLVSLLAAAVRTCCYVFIPHPWVFPAIEIVCNGPMYATLQAAGTKIVAKTSPRGLESTVQSLFVMAFTGLGVGSGYSIGGILYRRFSPSFPFGVASIVLMVASAFWAINLCAMRQYAKRQEIVNESIAVAYESTDELSAGDPSKMPPKIVRPMTDISESTPLIVPRGEDHHGEIPQQTRPRKMSQ